MADKLMYISNDDTKNTPSVDLNKWLKLFDTQLNLPTNQILLKSPKLLIQQLNKRYYKSLGTRVHCSLSHSEYLIF